MLVGFPGIFWDGTFHFECAAFFVGVDVLGHGAVGVFFYYEVEVALLVCATLLAGEKEDDAGVAFLTFIADGCVWLNSRFLIILALELRDQRTSNH